jgi:hypothetical protein
MLDGNISLVFNVLNSCVRVISKAVKFRFSGLNTNLRTQGESGLNGFLRFRARANRCAITRISANRETLYTDECFMNHGTAALCKRLLETGKWLTLAVGSRYERLIIELHRLADNSTGRYGYNLRLTRG